MPYIGKKPADIIATVIDTTTGTFSGEVDAGSLDVSGNADIDGTTNLDNTDIDGTLDVSGDLTVDTSTLYVDSANNRVGVGTVSPSQSLHVKGNIDVEGDTSGVSKIRFKAEETHGEVEGINIGNNFGGLAFKTNSNGSVAERMRIDSSGDVGIGTTNAFAKLVVEGDNNSNVAVVNAIGTSPNYIFDVRDDGTSKFRVDGSGNVGIGISSPDGKLHVHTASAGSVTANSVGDDLIVENNGDGGITILTPDANRSALFFGHASDNNKMQIRHDGNTSLSEIISDDSLNLTVGNGLKRINIGTGGDISFYEDTGTTAKLFWDASAEVLTSNVGGYWRLQPSGAASSPAYSFEGDTDTGMFRPSGNANNVAISTGGTERLRIDSSGHVSIGTSTASTIGAGIPTLTLRGNSASFADRSGGIVLNRYDGASASYFYVDTDLYIQNTSNSNIQFYTNNTRVVDIDNSGNLLVGKTAGGSGTAGIQLESGGRGGFTKDNAYVTFQNRLSSDGEISRFMKDGTTVGSIGAWSSGLLVGTGDVGLAFVDGTPERIQPRKADDQTNADGLINLGHSSNRFKDLYLSGGVYLGGTGSANKLDDYEEGTFTPTLNAYGGTPTFATATYTKVGNLVLVTVQVGLDGTSDASGFQVTSLPFTCMNTTNSVFGGAVSYTNSTFTSNIYVLVTANNTRLTLYQPNGSTVSYNDIGTNKTIRIYVIYRTT